MTVRDDAAGPRSISWRELRLDLDFQPTAWTPNTPDKYDSAGAATSTTGTARCTGGYEVTATWTLSEDGKKVWDLSGCRKAD